MDLETAHEQAEIIEGEIAEAEFHKDERAVIRLTARLDQVRAAIRDLLFNQ